MRPFSHKALIKCMRNIKLKTYKFTTFTTLQINLVNTVKSFHVWKSIWITPPHKEPFGLQKYQLYLYENVLKRHILSRLLHTYFGIIMQSQHLQPLQRKCLERHIPCLLHLCSLELKCRIPHLHNLATCS
jgi:hypothetical protein